MPRPNLIQEHLNGKNRKRMLMLMTSSAVPPFSAVIKAVVKVAVKVAVHAVVEAVLQRSSSQQYKAHVPLSPMHRAFKSDFQ